MFKEIILSVFFIEIVFAAGFYDNLNFEKKDSAPYLEEKSFKYRYGVCMRKCLEDIKCVALQAAGGTKCKHFFGKKKNYFGKHYEIYVKKPNNLKRYKLVWEVPNEKTNVLENASLKKCERKCKKSADCTGYRYIPRQKKCKHFLKSPLRKSKKGSFFYKKI